jgi:hypothetical protein
MEKQDLMFVFPGWQLPYFDALSEGSPETLRARLDVAERAILVRFEVLSRTSGREMERRAIREALDDLHNERDKLDFPYGTQARFKPV